MQRKKWTAQTVVTDTLLKFREKRKWQIALRRYALERNKSSFYAPYFGLDIQHFRAWIEAQFDKEMNWNNFSKVWQFDHIVPIAYFDFGNKEDLKLCWNFINLRVDKIQLNKNRGNGIDMLAAKPYFETLYQHTQYTLCLKMIDKINQTKVLEIQSLNNLVSFITKKKSYIEAISTFNSYEFDRLNEGVPISEVLAEIELLKKYG